MARRIEEKKAVLAALPKYPCDEALALVEKAMQNAALAAEAELAAKKIKELMLNQSLKVTASHNNGNAKNAIDGNLEHPLGYRPDDATGPMVRAWTWAPKVG